MLRKPEFWVIDPFFLGLGGTGNRWDINGGTFNETAKMTEIGQETIGAKIPRSAEHSTNTQA